MDRVRLLILSVDELRLGIPLAVVERVVHAVEVTPLANAPDPVLGVISLHGEALPVLDPRVRFRLPVRPLHPDDLFVIARVAQRAVALVATDTHEIAEFDADRLVPAVDVQPWLRDVAGLIRLDDGLLVVDDPERFLDAEGWHALHVQLDVPA